MLKQIKLKNFRKHRDAVFEFGPGLNTLRGENEQGKSTIFEAALFAMYGSRALRNSLDDAVTWGEPTKSLRVEATIEFDGQDYTFTRSKAGAEVIKDGQVFVTGQTEATNFATQLMGADANTASKLMLASQKALQGALEQGSKATSELVEGLAEFTFFDTLLGRMQERLPLGSDVSARQRLDDAKVRLDSFQTDDIPDVSTYRAFLTVAPRMIEEANQDIDGTLKPAYDLARKNLEEAKRERSAYDNLANSLDRARKLYDDTLDQYNEAVTASHVVIKDESCIDGLRGQIRDASQARATYQAFLDFQALPAYPELCWEGSSGSLQAEIDDINAQILQHNAALTEINLQRQAITSDIKLLDSKIQREDHCHACGQLLKDHKEIAERNKNLEVQIEEKRHQLDALGDGSAHKETLASLNSDLKDLKAVQKSSAPFDAFLRKHSERVVSDENFVPSKITWRGEAPSGVMLDVDDIQRRINAIEDAEKARAAAAAKVAGLKDVLDSQSKQIDNYSQQLQEMATIDLNIYQNDCDVTYKALCDRQVQVQDIKDQVRDAEHNIQMAEQLAKQHDTIRREVQSQINAAEREIRDLGFNNALLKKVRGARGPIADKLWAMVLISVSTMFSKMRGEESIVTKTKDGFRVNGEDVSSLSGSALDLLGLAIRVALVKTFLPHADMLVLDEPMSACSEERTERMLGFLATTGFKQTILITHEDVSETIADNLITL